MKNYVQILLLSIVLLGGYASPPRQNISADSLSLEVQTVDSTTVDIDPKSEGMEDAYFSEYKGVEILKEYKLPFGSDSLIHIDWPERWGIPYDSVAKNPIHSSAFYNMLDYMDAVYANEAIADFHGKSAISQEYNQIGALAALRPLRQKQLLQQLGIFKFKNHLVFLLKDSASFARRNLALASVNKQGEIMDVLLLYSRTGKFVTVFYRVPYIDKNGIIYIQNGYSIDADFYMDVSEKWHLNSEGKFIRYYEQNGFVKNKWEEGEVKNHKREGKWIEYRAMDIQHRSTISELAYSAGLAVGEKKCFTMKYDLNEQGYFIESSRRKGQLFYTEVYENGKLLSRIFVKKPMKIKE